MVKLTQSRVRGLTVKGQEVAKELESINQEITSSLAQIKKEDTEEKEIADYAGATAEAYRDLLQDYYIIHFIMGMTLFLAGPLLKTISK